MSATAADRRRAARAGLAPVDVEITEGWRIIHPIYGDMTEDVVAEFAAEEARENEELFHTANARQAAIAGAHSGPARVTPGFALKAQIDNRVYEYWRKREGPQFWKHEMGYMLKRHPELAVKAVPDQPAVRVDGFRGTPLAP